MNFKNTTPYSLLRIPQQLQGDSLEQQVNLSAALEPHRFHPRGKRELVSIGWISPAKGTDILAYPGGDVILITLQIEEAIIPAAAIRKALADKVAAIEKDESRKIYRKEQQQIKEDLIAEILPNALSKHKQVGAMIMPTQGFIFVGTGSYSLAETLLNRLREALGSLAVTPINLVKCPSQVMTLWVSESNSFPTNYEFSGDLQLADNNSTGTRANFKEIELGDDIATHTFNGMVVTRLSLKHQDYCFFDINNRLQILKLRLDVEMVIEDGSDDPLVELQANMHLISSSLLTIITDMIREFGGQFNKVTGDPHE